VLTRRRIIEYATEEIETVTFWRPTGPEELALVEASDGRKWPARAGCPADLLPWSGDGSRLRA